MTPEERQCIVFNQEGHALMFVSQHGAEKGAELIRLQIDGMVSALIRVEGAEKTAAYVFALGDRCAGGLRAPTDFRVPLVGATVAEAAPAEPPKPEQSP